MKLRKLLSVLLLPAIFLSTDAVAAGQVRLGDLAEEIAHTVREADFGPLPDPGYDRIAADVNNTLDKFLGAYATARPAEQVRSLLHLGVLIMMSLQVIKDDQPEKLKGVGATLIDCLQGNFVDRGIKIVTNETDDWGRSLRHAMPLVAAVLRPKLQHLETSNARLP